MKQEKTRINYLNDFCAQIYVPSKITSDDSFPLGKRGEHADLLISIEGQKIIIQKAK